MRKFSKAQEEAEINMTPMLDIVFIMLIFFIVTASFVKESGLVANKPPQSDAPPPEDEPQNCLVEVNNNNRIRLNFQRTDIGGLRPLIQQCLAKNAEAMVIIKMAPNAEAGYMVRIGNMALESGVPKARITYNKGQ